MDSVRVDWHSCRRDATASSGTGLRALKSGLSFSHHMSSEHLYQVCPMMLSDGSYYQ